MKRTIIGLVFGMMAVMAFAVPARKVTISHTQHDGTVLSLTLAGDEHMHYYLNTATGEAMRQGEDGDYYAIPAADLAAQTAAAETRRAQANEQRIAHLQSRALANGPRQVGTTGTITGSKKGLVILVNFSDKALQSSHDQAAFNNMFNQEGYSQNGHIGSVHDYFKDQSYNQFDLTFDVVGPVTLANNMAYYGGNNSSGNDLRPGLMAKQACQAVDASVNFADYDWDGDGYVDQVFIIYAGYGENYSGADENTIWPHEWTLSSSGAGILTVDGVKVNTYACTSELAGTSGTTLSGMGTAVHEFSHCLGYPDSYDTDYSGGIGMDSYDVMCGGSYSGPNGIGEVPAGYTAYERWCAGWLTPIELTSAATITNMPALNDSAIAYIIKNASNSNEYFMLENRQSNRWFSYYDSNTAGHGLFVMHIDYNSTVWSNNAPNDDPDHQRLSWIPADGSFGTYYSSYQQWYVSNTEQKGDFFPGTSNVTTLNGTSHSSVGGKWFTAENGSTTFSHEISSITEASGKISFDFDGGYADDGTRYSITLDACGGTVGTSSWTQTSMGEAWALPEPETTVAGWNGAGWATQPVTAYTPVEDVDLIDYGTGYAPAGNVTLYAVYIDDDADLCHSNPANFSVTLNAGTGTCATTTWTQGSGSRSLSLPTPTIDAEGWSFAGWCTQSVAETTTKPTMAASPYKPTADATLYAVYKKTENGTGKISTTGEIASGDQLIIVIADDSAAYAVQQGTTNYVAFTEQDEYAANIIWTATASGNGFTLKCGSNYIYNNGTGTTLSTTATNSTTVWVFTELGDNVFKVSRTDVNGRYICWTGSKFGAYAKGNWDNQIEEERRLEAGDGALYIYKVGSRRIYNSNPLTRLTGDVNKDGTVDVSDISTLAEYIFGGTPAQFDEDAADANGDGSIDVSDISTIAEIIFNN